MDQLTFHDQTGEAVAYSEDHQTIYRFDGRPIAYLDGDSVYSFSGRHMGWFLDGWIRDHSGNALTFTPTAQGGPMKPMRRVLPMKGIKTMLPMKGMRAMKPMRPMLTLGWSSDPFWS